MNRTFAIGLLIFSMLTMTACGSGNVPRETPEATQAAKTKTEDVKDIQAAIPGWRNKHLKFTRDFLWHNKMQPSEYEAWFNEKGEFRINKIAGMSATAVFPGSFVIWDGIKYTSYDPREDELLIEDYSKKEGPPSVHLFINDLNAIRIQNEIKQNTYKKVREVSKFNRDAIEYIATDELTEDIYALNGQDETLWKETGGNIREITITVDKEQQQLLEEVIVVNGKEVTRCTITLLEEIKTFDPALFQANVPEGTRRIEY